MIEAACHCGAVRFEIAEPPQWVLDCNCSVCRRSGYLHLIVPRERFRLLRGAGELAEYRFNTGAACHYFCRHCGIKSFYVPRSHPDAISVHARCLEPGTLGEFDVQAFDGANWERARAALG